MLDLLQHRVGDAALEGVARSRSSGSRFASAAPAAVTMFVAPGPIEDVATMICCRRVAFANATAASAIPCSFWARCVGSRSRASCRALPSPSTFPWPKIANTPGNSGTFFAVHYRPLGDEEADDRLRRRQPDCVHVGPFAVVSGQRGSSACAAHVSRIHACGGSSTNASVRPGAGPAMTLR